MYIKTCTDTTHKVMWEGFPLFLNGTTDMCRSYHQLSLSICTQETILTKSGSLVDCQNGMLIQLYTVLLIIMHVRGPKDGLTISPLTCIIKVNLHTTKMEKKKKTGFLNRRRNWNFF